MQAPLARTSPSPCKAEEEQGKDAESDEGYDNGDACDCAFVLEESVMWTLVGVNRSSVMTGIKTSRNDDLKRARTGRNNARRQLKKHSMKNIGGRRGVTTTQESAEFAARAKVKANSTGNCEVSPMRDLHSAHRSTIETNARKEPRSERDTWIS